MGQVLQVGRLLAHVMRGLWRTAFVLPRASAGQRDEIIRNWSEELIRLCGVRLVVHGAARALTGQVMFVANHVSWIDIHVIDAWRHIPFVAKAEIARWPILGWLAARAGTIFIERDRARDARRIVHHLAALLEEGGRVCVFPEGTTSDGSDVLPFHANLLQAAISAGARVQPLTLLYEDAQGRQSPAPAFVGDMTLVASLRTILRARPLTAHIYVGAPLPLHAERRVLAADARESVRGALRTMQTLTAVDASDSTSCAVQGIRPGGG